MIVILAACFAYTSSAESLSALHDICQISQPSVLPLLCGDHDAMEAAAFCQHHYI